MSFRTRSRWRTRRVVGAVLAAVVGVGLVPAYAAADKAPVSEEAAAGSECDRLQGKLPELAQRGSTRALCVDKRQPGPADIGNAIPLTAAALPDECLGEYPGDAWIINRHSGCYRELVLLRVIEVPSGRQIGTVEMSVINSIQVDQRSLSWTHDIQIFRVAAEGDVNGVIAEPEAGCEFGCTVSSSTPPFGLVVNNPQGGMTATSTLDPAMPNSVAVGSSRWTIRYTQMGAFPSEPADYVSEPVRCDNITPSAKTGCVLSRYTPTLTYTFDHNGELAQHIADAQASGLPGSPLSSPLTRQTDPELIDKNRRTACPSSLPRPPGMECDEYPFASTNQGAFLGDGYSRRMIDEDDNGLGGTELNSFYRENRIVQFDPFYVEVK